LYPLACFGCGSEEQSKRGTLLCLQCRWKQMNQPSSRRLHQSRITLQSPQPSVSPAAAAAPEPPPTSIAAVRWFSSRCSLHRSRQRLQSPPPAGSPNAPACTAAHLNHARHRLQSPPPLPNRELGFVDGMGNGDGRKKKTDAALTNGDGRYFHERLRSVYVWC